jgi:hypothetical protein
MRVKDLEKKKKSGEREEKKERVREKHMNRFKV